MDMTMGYLKERKQFGLEIGRFQALQHRAAHLYCEMEVARAAVLKAQQLLDAGYTGFLSYEPFAECIATATDIESQLATSMAWLKSKLQVKDTAKAA